jgi:hypothetical protein
MRGMNRRAKKHRDRDRGQDTYSLSWVHPTIMVLEMVSVLVNEQPMLPW